MCPEVPGLLSGQKPSVCLPACHVFLCVAELFSPWEVASPATCSQCVWLL